MVAKLRLVSVALLLMLIGANLATPIYPLLQQHLGLGPLAVALAATGKPKRA
ncbi:hypothetical protein [Kitasatospora sp. NPDC001683]